MVISLTEPDALRKLVGDLYLTNLVKYNKSWHDMLRVFRHASYALRQPTTKKTVQGTVGDEGRVEFAG
jgi:hypothetical protein